MRVATLVLKSRSSGSGPVAAVFTFACRLETKRRSDTIRLPNPALPHEKFNSHLVSPTYGIAMTLVRVISLSNTKSFRESRFSDLLF